MKQSFNTSKLYYGFPIFILGYQDKNFGHNITTCSSSYSLGDWLVIGVGSEENAADQIKHYQQFTVNIPAEHLMLCLLYTSALDREVAQLGRVLGLGPRCRRFESCLPDSVSKKSNGCH